MSAVKPAGRAERRIAGAPAGVDMREANLTNADFTGAHLTHADLSTATMDRTSFVDANLAEVWFPPDTESPRGWVADPRTGRLTRVG